LIDWKHAADWIEALGTIALWRPAYRASIIKLSRSRFTTTTSDQSGFGKLKERLARRLEKRELEWTADDVIWLVAGFVLLLVSSAIKIFLD
jgi:hypothetical protein